MDTTFSLGLAAIKNIYHQKIHAMTLSHGMSLFLTPGTSATTHPSNLFNKISAGGKNWLPAPPIGSLPPLGGVRDLIRNSSYY